MKRQDVLAERKKREMKIETREQAREFIKELTDREKIILFEMLSDLKQNPLPAEHPSPEEKREDQ